MHTKVKHEKKHEVTESLIALAPELLSVVRDCLSYADAMALLRGGEANELRDKCRAIIEKMELNNANT